MLHQSVKILPLLLPLLLALPVQAKDFTVAQKDKKFSQAKLEVKVGDVVSFKNEDPFSHNIFSLSDTKTFDLGSYPQGQSKSVAFDKPGTVEIECSVHPDMKLVIEVKK
ncbi:MAG: plastocyanin [Burkholderiaceae bacterium]|jgi:plastocyanin